MSQKSTRPRDPAKEQGEYVNFENALKKVLSVPRSELTQQLEKEKRTRTTKRSSHASRVSTDKH